MTLLVKKTHHFSSFKLLQTPQLRLHYRHFQPFWLFFPIAAYDGFHVPDIGSSQLGRPHPDGLIYVSFPTLMGPAICWTFISRLT